MKTFYFSHRPTWIIYQMFVVLVLTIFSSGFCSASVAKDKDSHIVFEKTLRDMLNMEKAVYKSIEKNDVTLLRKQLEELEIDISKTQSSVDRALLLGAWSSVEVKQKGHALADKLETLKVLNFIGLAFTSDYYQNPTKKVSASVKDSIDRFFVELKLLADGVARTNQNI